MPREYELTSGLINTLGWARQPSRRLSRGDVRRRATARCDRAGLDQCAAPAARRRTDGRTSTNRASVKSCPSFCGANREDGVTLVLVAHNLALAVEADRVVQIADGVIVAVRRVPPLPDLGRLSSAQKDELIVSLWQTLLALEGAVERPASRVSAAAPVLDDLRSRIERDGSIARAWMPRSGHAVLESRAAALCPACHRSGILRRFAIGWYQQARSRRAIARHWSWRMQLQRALCRAAAHAP